MKNLTDYLNLYHNSKHYSKQSCRFVESFEKIWKTENTKSMEDKVPLQGLRELAGIPGNTIADI